MSEFLAGAMVSVLSMVPGGAICVLLTRYALKIAEAAEVNRGEYQDAAVTATVAASVAQSQVPAKASIHGMWHSQLEADPDEIDGVEPESDC